MQVVQIIADKNEWINPSPQFSLSLSSRYPEKHIHGYRLHVLHGNCKERMLRTRLYYRTELYGTDRFVIFVIYRILRTICIIAQPEIKGCGDNQTVGMEMYPCFGHPVMALLKNG